MDGGRGVGIPIDSPLGGSMRNHGPTQRRVRRAWRLAALLSALALVAAACGDDDDDEAGDEDGTTTTAAAADEAIAEFQESGVTIGFADEDPFAFEDAEGNVTGEAPEVAAAVFERLDIEITDAQAVEFDGLIPGLNAAQYDVIAAGMFINPERAENVLFSNPDYCSGTAFAVPEGNPNDLNDFQDIVDNPDVTLGVLSGAVEEGFAEDNGVPGGQLETLALTPITVAEQTATREGLEAAEQFIPEVDGLPAPVCGGYGFNFDDQPLRDAFNEALAAMQDAGEILPIIEEFGFTEDMVADAAATTANEQAQGAYDDLGDEPFGG